VIAAQTLRGKLSILAFLCYNYRSESQQKAGRLLTTTPGIRHQKGTLMYPQDTTEQPTTEIPYGYCHCGCGQKTNLAHATNPRFWHVKGEPLRYLMNHDKRRYRTLEEAFLTYFRPGPFTECWEWAGSRTNQGYGRIWFQNEYYSAHRVSYERYYGPISDGLLVCHKCDNRPCVNPYHLFEGEYKDNMNDMYEKQRHAHGESQGCAKLTEAAIIEIRQRRARGDRPTVLAKEFGTTYKYISDICHYRTWKHVL